MSSAGNAGVRPMISESPQRPEMTVYGEWGQRLDLFLARVGGSDVSVLIQGETGVGKEVLARKLHQQSKRRHGPFLKLNCAALPSELVESELFGYERGAFTGAFNSTPGKFEMADQGTILLDEIGDMDLRLQAKLLQVLQDREFFRLGAREPSRVDVRIIAATHRNLEDAVAAGQFREDLFYRLNIIDIHIPPLRERRDEILPLAEFFASFHATPELPALRFSAELQQVMLSHLWPGNIRELENFVRKYLVLRNPTQVITDLENRAERSRRRASLAPPVPAATAAAPAAAPAPPVSNGDLSRIEDAHRSAEATAIIVALEATRWNRKQAAALLKIDYKALLYRMKKLGIGQTTSPQNREDAVEFAPAES